jgi:hypothetical protein
MNLSEIVAKEQIIFKTWGHDFSFNIEPPLKRGMRDAVLREFLGKSWHDLDGDEDLGKYYLKKLEELAKGIIFAMKYALIPPQSKLSPTGTIEQPAKMKRIRRKEFSRRFRIVMFITDWLAHTGHNRVNWPQVVTQWNKENPLDQYEDPSSLERLYNKARSENGIMVQLLTLKVLEGTKEQIVSSFSDAMRYLDIKDKDIDFAKRLMKVFGIKYEVKKGGKSQ